MAGYEYQGRNTQTARVLPGFRNIVAWQAASDLGHQVSRITARFGPAYFRLADQMRGAAISIGGNLAEGYCSGSLPNYIRYCHTARGSLGELGSYIQDCERDGLIAGAELAGLLQQYRSTAYLLDRLLQGLIKKAQTGSWDSSLNVREAPAGYSAGADEAALPYADIGTEDDLSVTPDTTA